jgi:hypothetical protein
LTTGERMKRVDRYLRVETDETVRQPGVEAWTKFSRLVQARQKRTFELGRLCLEECVLKAMSPCTKAYDSQTMLCMVGATRWRGLHYSPVSGDFILRSFREHSESAIRLTGSYTAVQN